MPADDIYVADRIVVHPGMGTVDIVDAATVVLHDATAQAAYRTAGGQRRTLRFDRGECAEHVTSTEITLTVSDDNLAAVWHIILSSPAIVQLELTNCGAQPLYLDDVDVLRVNGGLTLGGDPSACRVYQNGWQSWSPASAVTLTSPIYPVPESALQRAMVVSGYAPESGVSSDTYTVLRGESRSLLGGFVTTAQNFSTIHMLGHGPGSRLAAICHGDGALLPAGGRFLSEALAVALSGDPLSLLDLYMTQLGAAMRARVPVAPPTGWCSWYYYFGENTEDDVLANAAAIRSTLLPLEYVLLDDGYQTAIGDWMTASRRFRHGVPWLAGRLRDEQLKPGLWIAPFGVAEDSGLYARHPDWLLHDGNGRAVQAWQHIGVERPVLALDCTHPGVLDWLRKVFAEMAAGWGVQMFKIDFCFAAALPGRHFDPSATRASALRQGLEAIRDAIGDRFLLGCGMPLGPAVGIVDAMRIGPDVSFSWQPLGPPDRSAASTKNALLNTVTRSASHGKLWANDPDCVIARARGEENWLTFTEAQTQWAVTAMCGGAVLDSDNLTSLKQARLRELRRLLPPSNVAAITVDLFENDQPGLLVLPCERSGARYIVFARINWDDTPRTAEVDVRQLFTFLPAHTDPLPSLFHAYDLLNRRYLGIVSDKLRFGNQRPHSTALCLIKPVGAHPELLASTLHLLGGVVDVTREEWRDNRLSVEVEKPGNQREKLIVTVPAPYRVQDVRLGDVVRKWKNVAPGIIEIAPNHCDKTHLDVDFATP